MRAVFADSSFYVALANPRDQLHRAALEFSIDFRGQVVTSEFILLEVGNFFSSVSLRQLFIEFLKQLKADPNTQTVECSSQLLRKALDLFGSRNDKSWSLTDCSSFVLMESLQLTRALTSDHHFSQAGFEAILT